MPAPSTADQLLELVSKSGLLDPQQLQSYLQSHYPGGVGTSTPRTLANALVRDGLLTRFQIEQLLLGKWRNFILSGKYKVLGPLGAGGMGHVFLCEHLVMRRRVAVKVLPTSRSNNAAALERFHREARAVARLHHPNIVVGHDIDRDGKLHFLVMEYIDGATLHQLVKDRGPLDPLRAAHYIRQAALGLQHAHEAGLVHRDVKPSNLLLDRTGTIKVLDLGLARFFRDETDDLSRDNLQSPLGTTDFMAPEQALDSHQADIRADIYSLGATFYYLLAGHSPFREGTVLQKIMSHQTRPPRPIREIRPEVPEGMAAVLDRMMAKDPAQRYQTPAEVVEALAPWTQTPIPSPDEALTEPIRLGRTGSHVEVTPEPPSTRSGPVPPPTPWQQGSAASSGSQPSLGSLLVVTGELGTTPAPFLDTQSEAGSPMPSPPPPPPRSGKPSATARPRPSPQPPPPPVAPKRQRHWVIGAAAAAAVLLLGVVGFTIYKMTATKEPPPGNGSPSGPPVVVDNPPRLRLLVPAYFYPGGEDLKEWDKLIQSPVASSTVAIVNSSSGPGENADPNYTDIIERAKRQRVTMIGYVRTDYAKLPIDRVKADVDKWIKFYPGIQGIFFDEQASTADKVTYYVTLYKYAKGCGLSLVISNPGNLCHEDYLAKGAADVVCIADVTKEFRLQKLPPWADHYPASSFAAVLCQVDASAQMERYILEMRDKKIGYCYITDGHEPNPWKGLPRYWEDEVKAVQKINASSAP